MKPVLNVFNVRWVTVSMTCHSRRQGSQLIGGARPTLADEIDEYEPFQELAGYVLEQPSALPSTDKVITWECLIALRLTHPSLLERDIHAPIQSRPNEVPYKMIQLQPVGRLVPLAAPPHRVLKKPIAPSGGKGRGEQPADAITLRPVQSGQAYRITSLPARGLVRSDLAEALETVCECFAREHGFTAEKPLEIRLSRGFKVGSPGHGEGRAADIAAVGSKSLLEWKQEWEQAMAAREKLSDTQQQAERTTAEQKRNLGYGLYKALQEYGGWRVDRGWRPYRGVMQLFGPWTPTEGPWKAMQIKEPNPYQRQRLADQEWVFRTHQDHIHVAR